MYRLSLIVAVVAALASVVLGSAQAAKYGSFKTPSGNIVCGYGGGSIGCGIKTGLKPAPKNTCHDLDYSGKRMSVRTTGTAVIDLCAGDPGPFLLEAKAPVLAYGSKWRGGGMRVGRDDRVDDRLKRGRSVILHVVHPSRVERVEGVVSELQ